MHQDLRVVLVENLTASQRVLCQHRRGNRYGYWLLEDMLSTVRLSELCQLVDVIPAFGDRSLRKGVQT